MLSVFCILITAPLSAGFPDCLQDAFISAAEIIRCSQDTESASAMTDYSDSLHAVTASDMPVFVPLCEQYSAIADDRAFWLSVPQSSLPYYIRINVMANVVNVYSYVGDGMYRPYTAFLTSTGTYTLHEGVFPLSDKYEWRELYGGSYGHYACRIYSGLLFHSCPCSLPDVNTVDTEAYRALGTSASLGCMRLRDMDARWIYENCESGTLVEFYDSEVPGPFGKPEIQPLPDGAVKDPTA